MNAIVERLKKINEQKTEVQQRITETTCNVETNDKKLHTTQRRCVVAAESIRPVKKMKMTRQPPMSRDEKLDNLFSLNDSKLDYLTKQITAENKGYKTVNILKKDINKPTKAPPSPSSRIEAAMLKRKLNEVDPRTYLPNEPDPGNQSIKWKSMQDIVEFDDEKKSSYNNLDTIIELKSLLKGPKPLNHPNYTEDFCLNKQDVIVSHFIYAYY
jgi:hypothetical protein